MPLCGVLLPGLFPPAVIPLPGIPGCLGGSPPPGGIVVADCGFISTGDATVSFLSTGGANTTFVSTGEGNTGFVNTGDGNIDREC